MGFSIEFREMECLRFASKLRGLGGSGSKLPSNLRERGSRTLARQSLFSLVRRSNQMFLYKTARADKVGDYWYHEQDSV